MWPLKQILGSAAEKSKIATLKAKLKWEGAKENARGHLLWWKRLRAKAYGAVRRPPASTTESRHMLFGGRAKPIEMQTADGRRVQISRHGFENIVPISRSEAGRAMVLAIIDGERLYFYRSSGENSKMRGEWLPTRGGLIWGPRNKPWIKQLIKMEGHPAVDFNGLAPASFPAWVNEISRTIKANESKLVLHPEWDARTYELIEEALKETPNTRHLKTLHQAQSEERGED